MSRTIKTIERHMILPVRFAVWTDSCRDELGLQNCERKLVAEWQRGAEILGHAQRKLRLAFSRLRNHPQSHPQSLIVMTRALEEISKHIGRRHKDADLLGFMAHRQQNG